MLLMVRYHVISQNRPEHRTNKKKTKKNAAKAHHDLNQKLPLVDINQSRYTREKSRVRNSRKNERGRTFFLVRSGLVASP